MDREWRVEGSVPHIRMLLLILVHNLPMCGTDPGTVAALRRRCRVEFRQLIRAQAKCRMQRCGPIPYFRALGGPVQLLVMVQCSSVCESHHSLPGLVRSFPSVLASRSVGRHCSTVRLVAKPSTPAGWDQRPRCVCSPSCTIAAAGSFARIQTGTVIWQATFHDQRLEQFKQNCSQKEELMNSGMPEFLSS